MTHNCHPKSPSIKHINFNSQVARAHAPAKAMTELAQAIDLMPHRYNLSLSRRVVVVKLRDNNEWQMAKLCFK